MGSYYRWGSGRYPRSRFRRGYFRRSGLYGRFHPSATQIKTLEETVASSNVQAGTWNDIVSGNSMVYRITEGTGFNERIGHVIAINSIEIRMFVSGKQVKTIVPLTGADVPDGFARICMILDKQCNGAAMSSSDVFSDTSAVSFMKVEDNQRFKMLKEFIFEGDGSINPFYDNGVASSAAIDIIQFDSAPVHYYRKFKKPLLVRYNPVGPGGAITDLQENNITLFCNGEFGGSAVGNILGIVTLSFRINYWDM